MVCLQNSYALKISLLFPVQKFGIIIIVEYLQLFLIRSRVFPFSPFSNCRRSSIPQPFGEPDKLVTVYIETIVKENPFYWKGEKLYSRSNVCSTFYLSHNVVD